MKQYKLLEITFQDDQYLRGFYNTHNNIDELSYNELFSMLANDSYGESDFIHPQLEKLGIESKVVFYNNRNLQDKWNQNHQDLSYFDILISQIKEYSPDIILNSAIAGFTKEETAIIKESLPTKDKKMVGFHFSTLDDRFKQNVSFYDQIYTGSKSYVNMMRSCGIPAYLLRHTFEPEIIDKLSKSERKNEICFSGSICVGKSAHNNRLDMLDILRKFDVPYIFYGNIYDYKQADDKYAGIIKEVEKDKKEGLFGINYYSALNQYNICLNLHSPIIGDGAGNMRMFEATGLGICLLTDHKSENAELFDVTNEIVVYDSFEDMVEKAKWLINNPNKARKIALAGQKRTLAEYTYKNKAEQMNEYIQMLLI